MAWKHLRGPRVQFTVQCGATAVNAGVPFVLSSGLAVACSDGSHVDGVAREDMAINTDYYEADLLVPGSVWEGVVSSLTAERGVKLAMAGAEALDAGTAVDPAIGMVTDADVGSTATTVSMIILGEPATID